MEEIIKIMEEFIKIIDEYYEKYSTYADGKVVFECEFGELIFYKKDPQYMTIFSICVVPEYRQHGICSNIFKYIIDKNVKNDRQFKYFMVESVLSKILYEYLLRFKYNDKKFRLESCGFIYKF